ncbi:hypothetical protein AB9T88_05760 [Flavobacterium sp. LBUM151]
MDTNTVRLPPKFENIHTYIQHPKSEDRICKSAITWAKKDIQKGELVFSMLNGEGDYDLRQEKYIRILCKKHNLIFRFEMIDDAPVEEGMQGCYGAYMDNMIAKKFNSNFKQNLLNKADIMLSKSNDTIRSWDCDIKPKIEGLTSENSIHILLDAKFKKQLAKDKIYYGAGIDISFYIDKKGKPSGYHLDDYNRLEKNNREKYKTQFVKVAIDQLKKYQKCSAGEIKGQKVITKQTIRTYFH